MPEGDTIHRLAARLTEKLPGLTVEAAASTWPGLHAEALEGRRVARVEARGKHLLVHFGDGGALRAHLGLHGRVGVVPRERAPGTNGAVRLVLSFGELVLVCRDARALELLAAGRIEQSTALDSLGPDLLAVDFDEAEALSRVKAEPALPIGVALMDQKLVAGIGNVYKSELLFMAKVNPFAAVSTLSDATLSALLRRARRLLRLNLTTYTRRTANPLTGSKYYVYGRERQPCFTCGGAIVRKEQGRPARTTYYCPECQGCA